MRTLALLLCLTALASATVYTSAATGDFKGDSTWGGGGHPVAGDTAVFSGAWTVTLTANGACAMCSSAVFTGTFALTTYKLNVSGNLRWLTNSDTAFMTLGVSADSGLVVVGNVTVGARGKVTCSGASKISCAGSWDVSAGTFTKSTSTVTFNATSSGKTVKSGSNEYYNVTWNGSGGEWTLQDDFVQTGVSAFTLGTLILNGKYYMAYYAQTVTLGSGFTLNVGTGIYNTNYQMNLTVPTGATVTISAWGDMYVGHLTISGTGTFTATGVASIAVVGNVSITSPNFTAGTSTIANRWGAGTVSSTQPLYNYTIEYGAAITLGSNLTVQNTFTVGTGGNSFSAGSYTLTVGGNFANGDVFNAGTGTVIFNDATKTTTVSGTTTFYNLQCLTPGKTVKFEAGQTFTVTSFDFTGTAGNLILLDTDTGASTFTLSDATGTNQVEYCDIHRSAATGGAAWLAYTVDGNVDGGSNTGWLFAPPASTFNPLLLSGD